MILGSVPESPNATADSTTTSRTSPKMREVFIAFPCHHGVSPGNFPASGSAGEVIPPTEKGQAETRTIRENFPERLQTVAHLAHRLCAADVLPDFAQGRKKPEPESPGYPVSRLPG